MSNTNRDYLAICDVKNSKITIARPISFYVTDKNTSNIFIKLVTKIQNDSGISEYVDIENAGSYSVTLRIVKPNNETKSITASKLEDGAIYQVDLTDEYKDVPGTYKCELLIGTIVNSEQEFNTSDAFTYTVKRSILSEVGDIIETVDTTTEDLLNELNTTKIELVSRFEEKASKQEVEIERKRIDNLTTLTEGSTTGDAELIDARIGQDGVTYNNVGGAIRGQFSKFDELLNDCFQIKNTLSFTSTSSCYISKNGYKVTDAASFSMSEPIYLEKGKTIVLYGQGYNTQVSMISTCNSDESNIKAQVISTDSTLKKYSYTATDNCYVLLSYNNTVTDTYATIKIDYYNKINKIDEIESNINAQATNIDNIKNKTNIQESISFNSNIGYISHTSNLVTDTTNFSYSDPIALKANQVINIIGVGYLQRVAMITTCDNTGENRVPKVLSVDSTLQKYSYKAENDCYVMVSYDNRKKCVVTIDNVAEYIAQNEIEEKDNTNYMQIFHKIAGIGDSLMSGEIGYWDSTQNKSVYVDCYNYSWLSNICKNIGAEAVHYSCGGRTAKKWLAWDLEKMTAETVKPSAYFIALGTNDMVSETLGTISDCDSDTADTFYSNYAKIITEVKTFNPKAKIFCFSLYFSINNDNFENYNNAIKAIANKYNVYYVDFYNKYKYDQYNDPLIQFGHFTADGYVKVAEQIQGMINEIVKNNHDDFKLLPIDFLDI